MNDNIYDVAHELYFALAEVMRNQRYQKLTGREHFNPLSTEKPLKEESQRDTDRLVDQAIERYERWKSV